MTFLSELPKTDWAKLFLPTPALNSPNGLHTSEKRDSECAAMYTLYLIPRNFKNRRKNNS